jgi:hypothetical protein
MAFTEKLLTSLPPIELAGRHIKRYHITPGPAGTGPAGIGPAGIGPAVEKAALDHLPLLLPEPDGTPPATFAVIHRGADGSAYLVAYSWVWDNVLHVRSAAAAQPALDCPDDDPEHFVTLDRPWFGCVWELAPVHHERNAWVRHMLTPAVADLDGYLADSMASGYTR